MTIRVPRLTPGTAGNFIDACWRRPVARTPVWFMRQAGRSLPEYRQVRARATMFEIVQQPELAAEVTLQPVRRLGVDAAILFSDIVVPVAALGVGVELREGIGPVLADPFRGPSDLRRLRPLEPEADIPYVLDTVRLVVKELDVPLIGFAGAPFTLASYLVEGAPSKSHARTKALMRTDPDTWDALLDALADVALASLRAQVEAGAGAVQLFDSWAGALSPADYRRSALPASRRIFAGLADLGVPRIHFGVGTGELLDLLAEAGADVVGVDWRVPLDRARARLGSGVAVQGNLDPTACLAPWPVVAAEVDDVLARNAGRPGHVFNLGHGVLPDTDPGILREIVDHVHRSTAGPRP
ncbi:MAG TPA: uroporphyrinogen decarboxylase [Acidimicrobiales bacterium]|nr:uroporphyrinogen decarboxylase [Acidimicrobiales bacterium]